MWDLPHVDRTWDWAVLYALTSPGCHQTTKTFRAKIIQHMVSLLLLANSIASSTASMVTVIMGSTRHGILLLLLLLLLILLLLPFLRFGPCCGASAVLLWGWVSRRKWFNQATDIISVFLEKIIVYGCSTVERVKSLNFQFDALDGSHTHRRSRGSRFNHHTLHSGDAAAVHTCLSCCDYSASVSPFCRELRQRHRHETNITSQGTSQTWVRVS